MSGSELLFGRSFYFNLLFSSYSQALQSLATLMCANATKEQPSAMKLDFTVWDREIAAKKSENYEKLYKEMLKANEALPADKPNVELLWRLARITYLVSLNTMADSVIKARTLESYQYADKAVRLQPNNFEANLWLANSVGKLALIEVDQKLRAKAITLFLPHLAICKKQKPNDHMVLFMEGRLQLAMLGFALEEKAVVQAAVAKAGLTLPELNLDEAESKLRKAIELKSDFTDAYVTLAFLLGVRRKVPQAMEIIDKGLTLERHTQASKVLARDLDRLKESLVAPETDKKGKDGKTDEAK